MGRYAAMAALLGMTLVVAGCGGAGPVGPGPTGPDDPPGTLRVGPMVVRPAGTGGFKAESLGNPAGDCAFVALHGTQIDYLASQALLDRIVFSSDRDGFFDIWVCDLDGSNPVQLTNNAAQESRPQWSPDGTRIAFDRKWTGQDDEIMTMNADGSTIRSVTSNTYKDRDPTWSPDGRRVAFGTLRGNWEIYSAYDDGSGETNLTNHTASDGYPDWSRRASDPKIVFSRVTGGNYQVFKMDADGGNQTQLTSNCDPNDYPAWNQRGTEIAWQRNLGGDDEVFIATSSGSSPRSFSNRPGWDGHPVWSGDSNWIAFTSDRQGGDDIWLQETGAPYGAFRVTKNSADDQFPHLGSPTMQTERVLIGPPGSDWGGLDPVWSSAYAGICAFDEDGYRNFVRIGVRPADVGSIEVEPLMHTSPALGPRLVGVLIEANEIVNLREDAGRGYEPSVWDLDGLDAGAVVLYFDVMTGKLVSALVVDDSSYPGATGRARPVRQSSDGDRLVVEGDFSAVFDAQGRDVAPAGATRVTLDAEGNPTVWR